MIISILSVLIVSAAYSQGLTGQTEITKWQDGKILAYSLDKELYDVPLTLKTHVNPEWKEARVEQGKSVAQVKVQREGPSTFVVYQAMPGTEGITISKVN